MRPGATGPRRSETPSPLRALTPWCSDPSGAWVRVGASCAPRARPRCAQRWCRPCGAARGPSSAPRSPRQGALNTLAQSVKAPVTQGVGVFGRRVLVVEDRGVGVVVGVARSVTSTFAGHSHLAQRFEEFEGTGLDARLVTLLDNLEGLTVKQQPADAKREDAPRRSSVSNSVQVMLRSRSERRHLRPRRLVVGALGGDESGDAES